MENTLNRLLSITDGCRCDMHEPDEQNITARVVGDHLDNAFGEDVRVSAVVEGYQEFVVVLRRGAAVECFNLATLIALARRANLSAS